MNNKHYALATKIEDYITLFHKEIEPFHSPNYWVEVDEPVPHQFPLNAKDGYPLLPIDFNWFCLRLNRIQRYNTAYDYTVGKHVTSGFNFLLENSNLFESELEASITALGFLLHDMEETMIGDIISPVEKALGLDLSTYKSIIRMRCINRIVMMGTGPNTDLVHHLALAYSAFYPFDGVDFGPNLDTMNINQIILEFASDNLSSNDFINLMSFVNKNKLRPSEVRDHINTVDYLCFVAEARSNNCVGSETWGCDKVHKNFLGSKELPAPTVRQMGLKYWEQIAENIFSHI